MTNLSTPKIKNVMGSWYKLLEKADELNRIRLIIDAGDMCFYFIHDNKLYGSGESARIMFARIKDPGDEENTDSWRKEAVFTAADVAELVLGKESQKIFGAKECKGITVISSKEEIIEKCRELLK